MAKRNSTKPSAKVLAFTNAKGGVGKTTSTVNIGFELGQRGHRVLVVDLDPQADATTSLGYAHPAATRQIGAVLLGQATASQCILAWSDQVHLLPSGTALGLHEPEVYAQDDYHELLARHLKPVMGQYDFVLIDCPPALGTLTYMAFYAADAYAIPCIAEKFSFNKIKLVTDLAAEVTANLNPRLALAGIFFTRFNEKHKRQRRLNLDIYHATELVYGKAAILPAIRQDGALGEAQAVGLPTYEYAEGCNGVQDYATLTDAILKRL